MQFFRLIVVLSIALGLSLAVHADGGRLEINQTCAVNGGCFAGDNPGFPVEIADSGSYVLTGDIMLPADTAGIEIQAAAAGTTLDLNGHSIQGPEGCTDIPVASCSGSGSFHGVDADGVERITLMNGTISGMAGSGANLGDRARVLGMHVIENRLSGIFVVGSAFLRDISAWRNGDHGVRAAGQALITRVEAEGNERYGVYALESSHMRDSASRMNGDGGFYVYDGSIVESSTAHANQGAGFFLLDDSMAKNVSGMDNSTYGIICASASGVSGSTFADNVDGPYGPTVTNCVETGPNLCNGNTSC